MLVFGLVRRHGGLTRTCADPVRWGSTLTHHIFLNDEGRKDPNYKAFGLLKDGNFNIHIWAWFGYFILGSTKGPL